MFGEMHYWSEDIEKVATRKRNTRTITAYKRKCSLSLCICIVIMCCVIAYISVRFVSKYREINTKNKWYQERIDTYWEGILSWETKIKQTSHNINELKQQIQMLKQEEEKLTMEIQSLTNTESALRSSIAQLEAVISHRQRA